MLVLRVDTTGLPADVDETSAVDQTLAVLESRAALFGAGEAEFSADGGTITAAISDVEIDVARRLLLPRGELEFLRPAITTEGSVVCQDADGELFAVSPLNVNPDSATGSLARCFGQGRFGDPQWEPTPTATVDGQELTLSEMIEPGSWEIREGGALAPTFTEDGADLLEEVTGALTGYPLGFFVDGRLVGAPRINRAITNGNPFFSGFSDLEARILHAQLNNVPLPAPLVEAP